MLSCHPCLHQGRGQAVSAAHLRPRVTAGGAAQGLAPGRHQPRGPSTDTRAPAAMPHGVRGAEMVPISVGPAAPWDDSCQNLPGPATREKGPFSARQ